MQEGRPDPASWLTGQLRGLFRYRVGDWRVIYRLFKEKKVVEIVAILPRGDAYK